MTTVETLLNEYNGEVNIAAFSFFTWKSINNLAAGDTTSFQSLQPNALSWNSITHSWGSCEGALPGNQEESAPDAHAGSPWPTCTACDTDSEWGWIKMSGTATNGNSYGVGNSASDLTGFAWGGHAMGWISFNWQNCDTDVNGIWNACGLSGPSHEYKVYALGTLPNAPPLAVSLESNFLDRCAAPFAPTLGFMYKDNEGDPLMQYTINIYNASTKALADGPIYVPGPTVADTFTPTQYAPLPNVAIPVTYAYPGTALQYGNIYYFTVEVRDAAHLN